MPLNSGQIQTIFKKLGKPIFISQTAVDQAEALKVATTGMLAQNLDADAEVFDEVNDAFVPAHNTVSSVVNTVSALTTAMKNTITTYLVRDVAVDLGLASGTAVATVLNTLKTQMISASQSVAPSGNGGSNADGFAMYFATNFNIALPQDASPTIEDAWIDDAVV